MVLIKMKEIGENFLG